MMLPAGWKSVLAILVIMTSATLGAAAREDKLSNPSPDRTWCNAVGGFFASCKSIAVVIGISNYIGERAGGYESLPSARRDADKMVDFLIRDAGFDTVYILTDADAIKEKIDRLMIDIIPRVVEGSDRFLFYWSGHGDQSQPRAGGAVFGFLPLANSKRTEFSTMVSMDDISRWDRYVPARHSLFILDACLSGLAGSEKKSPRDARLQQLSLPAHHLLTAGTANESVIGSEKWTGSLFTDSFILGAKGDARGSSGIVSLFSLMEYIQDRVAIEKHAANWSKSLTPQLRSLQAGDGAFYFTPARHLTTLVPSGDRGFDAKNEPKGSGAIGPLSPERERTLKRGESFRECDNCPEMVVVPAGLFTMGSPEGEKDRGKDEGPQRQVTFARAFAAGRFAVTFDEWDACVANGGCNGYQPFDQGWGRGRRPVINVSWADANAYAAWLSRKTGKTYRLLSESEREYVTRAGTTTPFWWGASISPDQANYDSAYTYGNGPEGEYRRQTLSVDSFRPNPWGLYQVHGNVWEWTADCYHDSYKGAPSDGSAWTTGDCGSRVVRGGAWIIGPWDLRSAQRDWLHTEHRSYVLGFRLGRTLTP